MARSSFYYHQNKAQTDKYSDVKTMIKQIYHQHKGRFGYRRITLTMKDKGIIINHKTVLRLMKSLGLKSIIRVKKYKSYRGEQGKIAPNILKRNFKADQPNTKWATDVTEFNVSGNKLYLSPIIDLFNGEIISYNLSERPVFAQITDMLKKGLNRIKNTDRLAFQKDVELCPFVNEFSFESFSEIFFKQIGLYRIIGNDISGLHAEDQTYNNFMYRTLSVESL